MRPTKPIAASVLVVSVKLIVLALGVCTALSSNDNASRTSRRPPNVLPSVTFRSGRPQDEFPIALSLVRNVYNPLEITNSHRNLLVAVTNDDSNQEILVGWAQIRSLGTTAQRDATRYDAPPGTFDLQQDVDDQMWDEFIEDPNIQVPTGWASLPWTREYRAMEAGIAERQAKRAALVEQAERERRSSQVPLWELTSLFVEPDYRNRGIGTELVQRLCDEYQSTGKRLCDLYVATTIPDFFEPLGFQEVSCKQEIPASLKLSASQVCMKGENKTDEDQHH